MDKYWIKIKRILIVIAGIVSVLLGISGIIGIVIFGKPQMKTFYWYIGLGLLDLLLLVIGLFLSRIGLYGSEKDVRDVS
jgi:hypothetical protein